jgi:late competence protein required for DNA uptake (superfamily II DNA/RNA helicase)
MKEEAPECARCGEKSSEDTLTLHNCGNFYLCDDCYAFNERIRNEKAN